MINKKIIISILLIFTLVLMVGCSEEASQDDLNNDIADENQENPIDENPTEDEDTMIDNGLIDDYNALVEGGAKLDEIIKFIGDNISQVSKEDASIMIDKLEEEQKKSLPKLDEKFYGDSSFQSKMLDLYMKNYDIEDIYNTDDEELKELLTETKETGYKVETAEGMFFPIINYKFYEKYSSYVTDDMADYIAIMVMESNKVPAKDGALVIGWDEVIKRALSQEKFIEKYPESLKVNDMKELYNKYVRFIFFGLNNTPLFDYDSKVMVDEAKGIYIEAVENNKDSNLMKHLGGFLDILEKYNYKITEESNEYRKNTVEGTL